MRAGVGRASKATYTAAAADARGRAAAPSPSSSGAVCASLGRGGREEGANDDRRAGAGSEPAPVGAANPGADRDVRPGAAGTVRHPPSCPSAGTRRRACRSRATPRPYVDADAGAPLDVLLCVSTPCPTTSLGSISSSTPARAATTLRAFGPATAIVDGARIALATEDLTCAALLFAELYRREGVWRLRARVEGVFEGLEELGRRIGVPVTDRTPRRSRRPPGPRRRRPGPGAGLDRLRLLGRAGRPRHQCARGRGRERPSG